MTTRTFERAIKRFAHECTYRCIGIYAYIYICVVIARQSCVSRAAIVRSRVVRALVVSDEFDVDERVTDESAGYIMIFLDASLEFI